MKHCVVLILHIKVEETQNILYVCSMMEQHCDTILIQHSNAGAGVAI